MAGEEAGWLGRGGVQSGTSMNVPSVPSDITLPCLVSQPCQKRERERSRTSGWGTDGARVEQDEEEEEEKAEGGLCLRR